MTGDQQFIIALFAAVVPMLGLIITAIMKINQLHRHVNSRLTELLEVTRKAAHAAGVKEGAARAGGRRSSDPSE